MDIRILYKDFTVAPTQGLTWDACPLVALAEILTVAHRRRILNPDGYLLFEVARARRLTPQSWAALIRGLLGCIWKLQRIGCILGMCPIPICSDPTFWEISVTLVWHSPHGPCPACGLLVLHAKIVLGGGV